MKQTTVTSNVLLLTATINPMVGLPSLARIDPVQRLQDYFVTLKHYLPLLRQEILDRIIFAENSNANLEVLKRHVEAEQLEHQVEFVSFDD